MNDFKYNGGVLIIGSLLWQDHLEHSDDTIRSNWRHSRLLTNDKISVKTPIRYGRMSKSGIYTMCFSKSVMGKKLGKGFVLPFNRKTLTSAQIMEEVSELSMAEGMKGKIVTGKPPWSCIGLLVNRNRVKREKRLRLEEIFEAQYTRINDFDPENFKLGKEDSILSVSGLLKIRWPKVTNTQQQNDVDQLDFVLATVTKPTLYPRTTILAKNVDDDITRQYFLNNYRNGIETYQDKKVIETLKMISK